MVDVAISSLSTHVLLEWLGFGLMAIGMLPAIPGIIMIKHTGQLPSLLLGLACGLIISGCIVLVLSVEVTN